MTSTEKRLYQFALMTDELVKAESPIVRAGLQLLMQDEANKIIVE